VQVQDPVASKTPVLSDGERPGLCKPGRKGPGHKGPGGLLRVLGVQ
jgi:hypothetical protein